MSEATKAITHRDSPYFGLEFYDEKFGAWFFGREAEGSKIITNLRAARLTLLHAESGVGKSSLLRAGVAWRMRKLADDMVARRRNVRSIPVVFSSWQDDPSLKLAQDIGKAIRPYLPAGPTPALPTDRLDTAIDAASAAVNANLLIMLDQFEEYFVYRATENRSGQAIPERFADELARCIGRTDLRANFLISIREDAYAGLGDLFKGRIANVYGNYLHIDYLDRASAEQAIRAPLDVYNSQPGVAEHVELEDDLVDAVLAEVRAFGSDPGSRPDLVAAANGDSGDRSDRIATPLLQLVMERVWQAERAEGSRRLRSATLQKLRGVRMIVDAHLATALDSLGTAERQTAVDMFDHLVTPSGGKIAESVYDLAKRTGYTEAEVGGVLTKLDRERIVRPVQAPPGQDPMRYRRYEIFHDVLAPTINRAITVREEKRHTRRIRRLAGLAASLLAIVLVTALVFAYLLNKVNNERLTADARLLSAEADQTLASDPGLSTTLALQSLHIRTTSQAEDTLRAALPLIQTTRTFQDGSTVYSSVFDPADANKVVSADFAGNAWIWNVATGQHLMDLSVGGYAAKGSAYRAAFNPSGSEVAVGYGSGTLAVFNAHTGKKLYETTDGSQAIHDVEFLGNDEIVIASGQNLALWQPQSGRKCCDVLSTEPAWRIGTDPQNPNEFAVVNMADTTFIWNISDPAKPQQQQLGAGSPPVFANTAEFSQDGRKIVVAGTDGNVDVFDTTQLQTPAATFDAGEADAWTAAFSPDGDEVVAGYSSGTARVWDVATKIQLTLLAGNAGAVNSVQFNAAGTRVATASNDGTIRVWYPKPRELSRQFTGLSNGGVPNPMNESGFAGNRIIALDDYGNVELFTAAGQPQSSVTHDAVRMAWNQSGSRIAARANDGTVTFWQAAGSGYTQVASPSPIHVSELGDLDLSADGSRLATVTNGYNIQVRNWGSSQVLRTLNAANPVGPVNISPDGQQVVAGDYRGQIEVWKGTSTKPTLRGSPSPLISDIEYNRSGSQFVTASASGIVSVWDAHIATAVKTFDACLSPSTAEFSPDSSKLVVACGDGSVRVYQTGTGQLLTALQAVTTGSVNYASFSPDGNSIVTAVNSGNTGFLQLWSTELATPSLTAIERIAEQRVTQKLTAAQQQQYLTGN